MGEDVRDFLNKDFQTRPPTDADKLRTKHHVRQPHKTRSRFCITPQPCCVTCSLQPRHPITIPHKTYPLHFIG